MIHVTPTDDGGATVEAHLARQPAIYLDQDALADLARVEARRRRFLAMFQRKGTLLFSWTNAIDLSGPQHGTARRLRHFLDALGAYWIPLELNPWKVVRKENGEEPFSGTPCVSESFLQHYYPHVHGETLSLAKVVDLIHEDRASAQQQLQRLKDEADQMVQAWRAEYVKDPTCLDHILPPVPFDPARPGTFVLRELERLVTREAKGYTWMPNDGVDFMHAAVSTAYGDFVVSTSSGSGASSRSRRPRTMGGSTTGTNWTRSCTRSNIALSRPYPDHMVGPRAPSRSVCPASSFRAASDRSPSLTMV